MMRYLLLGAKQAITRPRRGFDHALAPIDWYSGPQTEPAPASFLESCRRHSSNGSGHAPEQPRSRTASDSANEKRPRLMSRQLRPLVREAAPAGLGGNKLEPLLEWAHNRAQLFHQTT
jgi:hypothetical protein